MQAVSSFKYHPEARNELENIIESEIKEYGEKKLYITFK